MLIHNADITGSLTINGVPYNTGSYTGIFKSGTNIISGNTVILTGSFTGSFLGDGSQLSGVTSYTDADTLDFINSLNVVSGSIQTVSTVSDTFTSATSYTVTHNFGTKEVIVSVYENDILIFPSSITTPTTNTVTITFPEPVTGRAVVVKAGHIVSGSINYNSVLNKPTLVSGSSQITYSGLTGIPSGLVSGSSQISFTGITNKPTLISGSSQIAALGYATTGSNQFNGNQSITGSLTVSGQVVAQTLNVQQVTSSVVFSSGSNRFGNNTGNTHQFTGSVNISGSLTTSIATLGTAATTFLTSDNGTIKSRTAAQTLSDIGGQATGSYVTVATNQSITGQKTFTKNIDVNGVYVGRGASSGDLFGGISGNTAIGSQALLSISTGYPNTAVGAEALRNITTGANNIAVGSTAGKLISAGTANETSTTSIYIGNDTRPSANGNTNEIVIGHTTTGNGSNTVTIGNSSITNTYLKGAVTLTGALNGTSATFSGLLTAIPTATTLVRAATFGNTSTNALSAASIGFNLGGGDFGAIEVGYNSNSPYMDFKVGASLTQSLRIASTGAATFSSSVSGSQFTANGSSAGGFEGLRIVNASTGAAQIALNNSAQSWLLNTRTDNHFSIFNGTASTTPFFISTGGNVGINTTSPGNLLHVAGVGRIDTGLYFNNSGTNGAFVWQIANESLRFGTNDTERMRITSGGNVGIGTASPNTKLHVVGESRFGTATNYVSTFADASGVYFENTGTTTLTRQIRIQGINDAGNAYTQFYINHGAGNYQFWVNDQLRIRIDGDGLKFNGDTAAANALDDYEEGTWTPTLPNGGTLNNLQARYVKIGQKVTLSFYSNLIEPTNNSSNFIIGGLPFANAGLNPSLYFGGSFGYVGAGNLFSYLPITGANFNYIYFHANNGTSATKTNANFISDMGGGNREIIITITYFTAS